MAETWGIVWAICDVVVLSALTRLLILASLGRRPPMPSRLYALIMSAVAAGALAYVVIGLCCPEESLWWTSLRMRQASPAALRSAFPRSVPGHDLACALLALVSSTFAAALYAGNKGAHEVLRRPELALPVAVLVSGGLLNGMAELLLHTWALIGKPAGALPLAFILFSRLSFLWMLAGAVWLLLANRDSPRAPSSPKTSGEHRDPPGGEPRTRRVALVLLALMVLGFIVVKWGTWRLEHASFDPRELKRPWETYAVDLPAVIRHCLVAGGTSETDLIRRFGQPDAVLQTGTQTWEQHIKGWRGVGYTVPDAPDDMRVLVYDLVSELQAVHAYHFIDDFGELRDTFIGET